MSLVLHSTYTLFSVVHNELKYTKQNIQNSYLNTQINELPQNSDVCCTSLIYNIINDHSNLRIFAKYSVFL